MKIPGLPPQQGLYDPRFEHDACGVGFVCDINGVASHRMIRQGLEILKRLEHRGAVGADPATGDGAGILIQMPHTFFAAVTPESGIILPEKGAYGTGLVFLPQDETERSECKALFAKAITECGCELLGWRNVPVDNTGIGRTARETQPVIEQPFIKTFPGCNDELTFDRKLYLIRRMIENAVAALSIKQKASFYITNFSCRTFSYKGLLMTAQVEAFFCDLNDERMETAISLVHSRYSTNTFPTWDLAQPFRFLAHNGEINTLRGNINWTRAKEALLESELFGAEIDKLKPIIVPGGSDSAGIDNMFELLALSGRSLPHAMMMLIPAAWEQNDLMDPALRAFYKYHTCLMEPWDGPAAIAYTDGVRIGAVLDRNGLRPARYIVTKDDMVVMSSEVGVLDIAPGNIAYSGRLEPGKMFFIDTAEKRIIDDDEIKTQIAALQPYETWLNDAIIEIADIPEPPEAPEELSDTAQKLFKAFDYTREDLKVLIKPMAETAQEPTGAMGNDSPHSVLSNRPKLLYTYFKQLFAQVTNPAIDPIREELVMSLECYMGGRRNLLSETPGHCRKVHLKQPVLTNDELFRLKHLSTDGFSSQTISLLFKAGDEAAFNARLDAICAEATQAIQNGVTFLILSDRGVRKDYAALPALLAVGTVHEHLVAGATRSQVALILESAEPREVHHFAVLFGYGLGAVNPYLAYESLKVMIDTGELALDFDTAQQNYIKAIGKGIKKTLSKMGISTLQGYRGAQIFEALGVHRDVIDRSFTGTVSRIGGVRFEEIAQETIMRHKAAYPERESGADVLATGGIYQWKKDGEFHLWNPETIAAIQDAARMNDVERYKEFARLINDQSEQPTTLRSLLQFKKATAISIDEVESKEEIFKRFATGAMSFGSISRGAHETLAIAMNRIGGKSNTGEGGEDPERFHPLPNGDSKRSAIKQVASGRFGVTINYLSNADEIQIKIAQGAKPGEGGQLPGHKVSATIAKTRYTTPGVTLISPPPHHDIYSIEDLAQLIYDLKNANPAARISVKLVSEIGVGTIAAGVAKGHADMILISGFDGGTGASPKSSIQHAGLPWELGLSETHQTLVLNDLRSRVRLQTDGQLRTGRDVAIAALLGAEEYGFCTIGLIIMGCVMLRHCHLNNCSVGVATQDDILQSRFAGRAEWLVNYFHFVVEELRQIMASLGFRTIDEMVGRTDLLEVNEAILPWKARHIDYERILYRPKVEKTVGVYCTQKQDHKIDSVLDRTLIELAQPAIRRAEEVKADCAISNVNRTTGAMLSGEIVKQYGESGLPEDTVHIHFKGVAGQSFGAFLARGVTFELEGLANDYIGKGLSGGKIIVYPARDADYAAEKNIIIGNTTFYGAIAGFAYIRGRAGERFCIRNSGLNAVVEGVGDHGCEYMTGGCVVVIGPTGRNFAAGMSGGVAYVYDVDGQFKRRCNKGMVELEALVDDDRTQLIMLLKNHYATTKSIVAKNILDDQKIELKKFIKIMPIEYKKILAAQAASQGEDSDG